MPLTNSTSQPNGAISAEARKAVIILCGYDGVETHWMHRTVQDAIDSATAELRLTVELLKSNLADADANFSNLVADLERMTHDRDGVMAATADLRAQLEACILDWQKVVIERDTAEAALLSAKADVARMDRLLNYHTTCDDLMIRPSVLRFEFPFHSSVRASIDAEIAAMTPATRKDANIEEERRLAYVGVTRARKQLFIAYALSRVQNFGRKEIVAHSPSRFLKELGL